MNYGESEDLHEHTDCQNFQANKTGDYKEICNIKAAPFIIISIFLLGCQFCRSKLHVKHVSRLVIYNKSNLLGSGGYRGR